MVARLSRLMVLSSLLLPAAPPHLVAQSRPGFIILAAGDAVARELPIGGEEAFGVAAPAGSFVRVIVEQGTGDLKVTVVGPDDAPLEEVDGRFHGPEPVGIVARAGGIYRFRVQAADPLTVAMPYSVSLDALRLPAEADQSELRAAHAATLGKKLLRQGTGEARRAAIFEYEQALASYRQLGDRLGEAQVLNSIGFLYNALGENRSAVPYYDQALTVWRAAGDRQGQAEVLNNLAAVRSALGEKREALALYEESLPIRRAIGDRRGEAISLANLSATHQALGNSREALEYVALALPLFRQLGDSLGQAAMLNATAVISSALGERRRALDAFGQMLELTRAAGDRRGQAAALYGLSGLFLSLGDLQTSLTDAAQALTLVREQGDRRTEAYVLTRIAQAHQLLGDLPMALATLREAVPLAQGLEDRYLEAGTLNNLGFSLYLSHELAPADAAYREALSAARQAGDRRTEASILTNIGLLRRIGGELPEAAARYQEALAIFHDLSDRDGEAGVLEGLARLARDRGQLTDALAHLEEALALVELLRWHAPGPDLRASYAATKRPIYDFNIELLMQLHRLHAAEGYDRAALQASERARARSLLETLSTSADAEIRKGSDQALLGQERVLRQQINARAARHSALVGANAAAGEIADASAELEMSLAEHRQTLERIRTESPAFASLTQPGALNIGELQALLEPEARLLEFVVGDERSFLWVVSRTSVASFDLPARSELEPAARRVRELIATDDRTPTTDRDYANAAAALSRMLIGPAAPLLVNATRLLIVADGVLQYLPFGALPFPDGKGPAGAAAGSIASGRVVVMLPSASVLGTIRGGLEQRQRPPNAVAVLADPVFAADDPRVRKPAGNTGLVQTAAVKRGADPAVADLQRSAVDVGLVAHGQFSRLPATRREAREILRLGERGGALQAVDFDASLATATSPVLGQYRIVHFATHAVLNSVHPELSGLVLSLVDERGAPEDGFLRLQDVYNLDLPADLVVLSACETGLGKEVKGEGIIGLTRGFMYAGAARVVVSLWNVDDEATAALMQRFYQKMLGDEQMAPAAALRAAQLDLAAQPRWRSPHYWAGFVLYGEPR